jgi:hypothetical protein
MHFPFSTPRRPADHLPGIEPACVTASAISRLPVQEIQARQFNG